MQEYEGQEEDEFQQSGGGKWIKWIGIIAFILIILAYAWQTLELVGWLFPGDNWFMKVVTVFVCDGCATGYAMAEMFYRFRLRTTKSLVFGMWIITFIFSTLASIIQMYLSSTHNIPHAIDPTVISVAYGIVIGAFVVNIIAITVIIRMEHNASQPQLRYLDDKPRGKKRNWFGRQQLQQSATSTPVQQQLSASSTPSHDAAQRRYMQNANVRSILDAMDVPPDHMDEVIESLIAKGVLKPVPQEAQTSPLAQPELETKASQNGHKQ